MNDRPDTIDRAGGTPPVGKSVVKPDATAAAEITVSPPVGTVQGVPPDLPPIHWKCPDCLEPCRCSGAAREAPHYRCGIPKVDMGEWIHVGNPPTLDESILWKLVPAPSERPLPFHARMHGE